jgi:hypothetical protein
MNFGRAGPALTERPSASDADGLGVIGLFMKKSPLATAPLRLTQRRDGRCRHRGMRFCEWAAVFPWRLCPVSGSRPGSGHYFGQRSLSGLHLSEQALHLCGHFVIPDR